MLGKQLQTAAAGNAGGEVLGIEDVFSTWLYTGNGSTQTITNGIDLAGEGGLVWTKAREVGAGHALYDTARGATKFIQSDTTGAQITASTSLTSFNADGFTLGADGAYGYSNYAGYGNYASWTFRKAEKFFDVVTYTGTGTTNNISHNLGSTPGCIIIKRTNTTGNWAVYHRSRGTSEVAFLNTTDAFQASGTNYVTGVSSTTFTVQSNAGDVNASGSTYVAYLFAHDAGGFGDGGTESVIKCGAMTSYARTVDLGWEPQWVLVKSTATSAWFIIDSMRGWTNGSNDPVLQPHVSNAEYAGGNYGYLTPTGFVLENYYNSDPDVIYIAIRRGPIKTPEDATTVFSAFAQNDNTVMSTGFPVDLFFSALRAGSIYNVAVFDRSRGAARVLETSGSDAEYASGLTTTFQNNTSIQPGYWGTSPTATWTFRRAPGFFDVVAYTGTGVARTVSHNLGVVPELIITKCRSAGNSWGVYTTATGNGNILQLNKTDAAASGSTFWNNTTPTSTVFTVGTSALVNDSGATYIAYLFATCPGVSKVGSYTGTGTTLNVDCGFTAGARFVMIKRTDANGDWRVWDTARGIVVGNEPYLMLNSTTQEISVDYINPLSSGFQVTSTGSPYINVFGASYIFLAIA